MSDTPGSTQVTAWDAIVVAGGRASRLGGIEKADLRYQGRTLVQCALDAVQFADRVSVVGYDGSISATVGMRRTRERPRWAGPAAAVVAGLSSLRDDAREFTAVVAGDLPRAAPGVAVLIDAVHFSTVVDGVIAVDSSDRRQFLLAIYRTSALVAAAEAHPDSTGLSMRALVGDLDLTEIRVRDELCADVDTPIDAAAFGISLPNTRVAVRTG